METFTNHKQQEVNLTRISGEIYLTKSSINLLKSSSFIEKIRKKGNYRPKEKKEEEDKNKKKKTERKKNCQKVKHIPYITSDRIRLFENSLKLEGN